ncbi:hypothetical protein G8O24_28080 [Bradyrhizobium sp. INPA01-394B]|uniref:Uncharacterized protein n=1 Tax=Bradyrhizobium campsiandrae TaxID=1729892 RepID=A0ABR7UDX3_9BRAD|nr:hypothetical protein [Bradyrhizobium campsiandrae]MBC9881194.1 hypothetical protein [Bradyrhizobium campsiandrae]MBC9981825.1 hypothetical protein [Bradyrhizobium campsiandrae]
MRQSSKSVVPSAFALLSTILLCSPAASQTATGAAAPLPSITVEAPKQATRPKPVVSTETSHRTSSTGRTRSANARPATARTPTPSPDSPLGRIARLEKVASSCNGGCASSFPSGKDPWIGCSESGGGQTNAPFSPTCRDTITHKSYVDCVETKVFLGEYRNRAYWLCSSLSAGNQFKVAELKRSRR